MHRARLVTAWFWIVGPLLVLAWSIWDLAQKPFGLFSAYPQSFLLWAVLLGFMFAGFWGVIQGPGSKWFLRLAAVLVALYTVLMFLISSDHGFHGGEHDYVAYSILGALFLFCVFTFIVAGMQPNSTIERDGPQAARPSL